MFWVPERHLQSFTGTLQVDAYADFHHLYNIGRISEAACWAHARRRFHDSMPRTLTKITEAIECIAALYAIEKAIRGSTPELRRKVRQTRAAPLLANMHAWLEDTLAKLSKKSDTAAAIRYALSRWRAPRVTSTTAPLRSTTMRPNAPACRCARPEELPLRRFRPGCRTRRRDVLPARLRQAQRHRPGDLSPAVLERIADHPISRIEELLPWNVSLTLPGSPTHS